MPELVCNVRDLIDGDATEQVAGAAFSIIGYPAAQYSNIGVHVAGPDFPAATGRLDDDGNATVDIDHTLDAAYHYEFHLDYHPSLFWLFQFLTRYPDGAGGFIDATGWTLAQHVTQFYATHPGGRIDVEYTPGPQGDPGVPTPDSIIAGNNTITVTRPGDGTARLTAHVNTDDTITGDGSPGDPLHAEPGSTFTRDNLIAGSNIVLTDVGEDSVRLGASGTISAVDQIARTAAAAAEATAEAAQVTATTANTRAGINQTAIEAVRASVPPEVYIRSTAPPNSLGDPGDMALVFSGNPFAIQVYLRVAEGWSTMGLPSHTINQTAIYPLLKSILVAGTNVTFDENDATFRLTINAAGGGGGGGTTYTGTAPIDVTGSVISLDDDGVDLAKLSAAVRAMLAATGSTYTAGDGLDLTGTEFSVSIPLELTGDGDQVLSADGSSAGNSTIVGIVTPDTGQQKAFGAQRDGETWDWVQFAGGLPGPDKPGFALGPGDGARDVNLYREAANILRTDDTMRAAALIIDGLGTMAGTPSLDTHLATKGYVDANAGGASAYGDLTGVPIIIDDNPSPTSAHEGLMFWQPTARRLSRVEGHRVVPQAVTWTALAANFSFAPGKTYAGARDSRQAAPDMIASTDVWYLRDVHHFITGDSNQHAIYYGVPQGFLGLFGSEDEATPHVSALGQIAVWANAPNPTSFPYQATALTPEEPEEYHLETVGDPVQIGRSLVRPTVVGNTLRFVTNDGTTIEVNLPAADTSGLPAPSTLPNQVSFNTLDSVLIWDAADGEWRDATVDAWRQYLIGAIATVVNTERGTGLDSDRVPIMVTAGGRSMRYQTMPDFIARVTAGITPPAPAAPEILYDNHDASTGLTIRNFGDSNQRTATEIQFTRLLTVDDAGKTLELEAEWDGAGSVRRFFSETIPVDQWLRAESAPASLSDTGVTDHWSFFTFRSASTAFTTWGDSTISIQRRIAGGNEMMRWRYARSSGDPNWTDARIEIRLK